MKNNGGFAAVPLVLVALAIIVMVGGYFAFAPKSQSPQGGSPAATSTVPQVDTSTWRTYQNEKLEFSFRYPGEWGDPQAELRGSGTAINFATNRTPSVTFQGALYDNVRGIPLTLEEFLDRYRNDKSEPQLKKETIFIDGVSAVKIYYVDVSTSVYVPTKSVFELYFPLKGGGILVVNYDVENTKESSAKVLFDNFISTFKFIASTSGIDTFNWQTYRNEQYGFEVRYPSNLLATETHDSSSNPNVVYITNPVQGLFDGDQPADRLLVKINPGTKCVLEDWKKRSETMSWKTACVEDNPNYFIIMSALSEESQKVFDQVLSTFKFIP